MRILHRVLVGCLVFATTFLVPATSQAGKFFHKQKPCMTTGQCAPVQRTYAYTTQTQTRAVVTSQQSQIVQQTSRVVSSSGSDPYGFTNWLNSVRGERGLPAVGYDPSLSDWANANNSHQHSRGIGHYVMGPARRQNSAMGSYGAIGGMWMTSPAHRAALLDPSIRFIGIAGMGAYWTFNAY